MRKRDGKIDSGCKREIERKREREREWSNIQKLKTFLHCHYFVVCYTPKHCLKPYLARPFKYIFFSASVCVCVCVWEREKWWVSDKAKEWRDVHFPILFPQKISPKRHLSETTFSAFMGLISQDLVAYAANVDNID